MMISTRIFAASASAVALGSVLLAGCSSADTTSSDSGASASAAASSAPAAAESSSSAPATSAAPVESPTSTDPAATEYTLAQVETHNSSGDCWTVVEGKVYDLTDWEDKHPGGAARIQSLCGIDGTSLFLGQHEGDARPTSVLEGYQIGVLAGG